MKYLDILYLALEGVYHKRRSKEAFRRELQNVGHSTTCVDSEIVKLSQQYDELNRLIDHERGNVQK